MKEIARGGVLEHVFNRDGQDKQCVRTWLLEGAPLPNETIDSSARETGDIKIRSHEAFKFVY